MDNNKTLKLVPDSKKKCFLHSDKFYKISGSAIIAVNDYLKFISTTRDYEKFENKMKYIGYLTQLGEAFNKDNIEEV